MRSMIEKDWAYYVVLWSVVIAAAGAVLFPLCYARSPWRSSQVGRAVMLLSICLGSILGFATLAIWFPGFPGQKVVRTLLYPCLALALWYQLLTLLRVQRQARR